MKYSLYTATQTSEINALFTKTFSDSEGEQEGQLIGQLVEDLIGTTKAEDLYVFVATENEKVIGSILFTRLTFEVAISVFLLAPVAVHTDYQGKGVGQALINFGLQAMKKEGVELAFTYGDPSFYSKVAFQPVTEAQFKAPLTLSYPHGWLAQSLSGQELLGIDGDSSCVPAFNKPELW